MTNCKKYQSLIEKHLDGDPNDAESADLKAHTQECTTCHEEFQRIGLADGIIKDAFTPATSASQAADLTVAKLTALPTGTKCETFSVWRTAAKSRITKLTAAAVIIVAVIIGIKSFNGTTAWADVLDALNGTNDVHFVMDRTHVNGETSTYEAWLKNRVMLRSESSDRIDIDDGVNRLVLDREERTAQMMDSFAPFKDFMAQGLFELLLLFREKETPYEATELPDESTSEALVYKVAHRGELYGKVWVDPQSRLPLKITSVEAGEHVLEWEAVFDYEPIPEEMFALAIPQDYEELGRLESARISGKVVDEEGKPVADAVIYAPDEDFSEGKTDDDGEFVIKLPPYKRMDLAMVLWAYKTDDPSRVAWMFIRNPEGEGHSRNLGMHTDALVRNWEALIAAIGGNPGEIMSKTENELRRVWQVEGIVLQMGPASVVTGRITNHAGKPIAGAKIWADRMRIRLGSNEINLYHHFGPQGRTITDAGGYYKLSNLSKLPGDGWSNVTLEAEANGYATRSMDFVREEGCDLVMFEADVTIRGTVIDNYGQPLVGREVGVEIEEPEEGDGEDGEFEIEETIIDEKGKFELTGVPAVAGLLLRVRSEWKPRDWQENEQTRGRQFIYYQLTEMPVDIEPGKKEYWVEIVPQRPDITITVEVKDSNGGLLENIPIGVCSPGFTEGQWYATKLIGMTGMDGVCTITEVPRTEPCKLWICEPKGRVVERAISQELRNAIAESLKSYSPAVVPIELQPARKHYKISVTLQTN